MIKIITKEAQDINFENAKVCTVYLNIPFEITSDLNALEIFRTGIVQIEDKAFSFSIGYFDILKSRSIQILAENLVELIEYDEKWLLDKDEIKLIRKQIKVLELLIREEVYNIKYIIKLDKLKLRILLNKYAQWKGNIWK